MLPETRFGRRILGGLFIVATTASSVFCLRGRYTPYISTAPAYRQKGPADAPVVIAEFSDFQCPSCAAAVEPLKHLLALYPGKIEVRFKHFPWYFHPHAKEAAIAAECAGQAGKFWEFHDTLYSRQSEWIQFADFPKILQRYAKELGLDPAALSHCMKNPAVAAAVDADLKEAKDHWVNSTPTFFINGERFVGAKQLRTLGLNRVERLLGK